MSILRNLSIISFSILIALVFLELILRIFEIGYGNAPLERSHKYHHMHPFKYEFLMYDPNKEFGGFEIHYDVNGFRVNNKNNNIFDKPNKKKGIIFLGDSFTEANQVPFHKTYVNLVGESLNKETINLGVSSYSPIIYRIQALNILNDLKPKKVVLQLYSNDFKDDENYLKSAIFYKNNIIAIDGGKNSRIISILRKSYLIRLIRKNQLLIKKIINSKEFEIFNENNLFNEEQNITSEKIRNTVEIISDIKKILTKQEKELYVFLIPSKFLTKNKKCCADDNLYSRVYNELKQKNIKSIDVANYFEKSTSQSNLFFKKDIHLTEYGNVVLSEAITDYFITELKTN